jgi:hypothetical protein
MIGRTKGSNYVNFPFVEIGIFGAAICKLKSWRNPGGEVND